MSEYGNMPGLRLPLSLRHDDDDD